jgi:outer membrane protein OmpA-like peptidoglycan-associated protein/outer membrane protein W
MKLRTALLAATVLAAPAAAIAQPVSGPYVSLGAGGNIFENQNIKSFDVPALGAASPSVGGHISTDADIIGTGAVGYGLGNGLRIELNGDWFRNAERSFAGSHASGFQEVYGGFVNVLYDFDLTPYGLPGFSPYVGVGAGYGQTKFDNGAVTPYGGSVFLRNTSTDGDFAAQGIVGLAYNIAAIPGLALTVEYRFTAIPQNENYHAQYFAPGVATRATFKTDGLYDNAGLVGLRYALFQPAPPPPPPPAQAVAPPPPPPAEARTYLVFFDWDRADLSERARQIVAQAAAASTKVQTTTIEVNGYTDLSGTAAYNQRLSVRRAQSVEAELVRDGVQRSEISIHGYGESNPLVPTAKGVREPQNRRVEIILK